MSRSNIGNVIILLQLSNLILGAFITLPQNKIRATVADIPVITKDNGQLRIPKDSKPLLSNQNSSYQLLLTTLLFTSNPNISRRPVPNLVQTVFTMLKQSPPPNSPNEKLFGGVLPSFIERVIQRIQNYFSEYNSAIEYFEGNRPPVVTEEIPGTSILCSSEESTVAVNHSPLVLHNDQVVNDIVINQEPPANEYTSPLQPVTEHSNVYYVYLNATKINNFDIKNTTDSNEELEEFKPYTNATYSIFIRSNKLEEYSNNIKNVDNSLLNPDILPFVQEAGMQKIVRKKCGKGKNCSTKPLLDTHHSIENIILNSRSAQDVPDINLILVPSSEQLAKKSCNKNEFNKLNIEYLVLKPDDGSPSKSKYTTNTYSSHKTKIDISATNSPPTVENENLFQKIVTNTSTMKVTEHQGSANRLPLLFNLFKRKPSM